jgi:lysozyme
MKQVLSLILTLVFPVLPMAQEVVPPRDRTVSQSQIEDLRQGVTLGAAEVAAARPLNQVSLVMIKEFEGWVPSAYDDPSGYCTIGYGHLIALDNCKDIDLGQFSSPLTISAGEELLLSDTASARLAIKNLIEVDLTDDQFGSLVSLVFNVGKANFHKSTLRKALNAGDYEQTAKQFRVWIKSNGRVLDGLVERRACEEKLFREFLQLNSGGGIRPPRCRAPGAADALPGPAVDIESGE